MEIQGTVKQVFPAQSGVSRQGNQWVKQEFIVEYVHGQYPKTIMLSTLDANIAGKLQIGQEVSVKFDFTVREWTNDKGEKKYFNEPQIWRDGLHMVSQQAPQQQFVPQQQFAPQQPQAPQYQQQAPAPQYQQQYAQPVQGRQFTPQPAPEVEPAVQGNSGYDPLPF